MLKGIISHATVRTPPVSIGFSSRLADRWSLRHPLRRKSRSWCRSADESALFEVLVEVIQYDRCPFDSSKTILVPGTDRVDDESQARCFGMRESRLLQIDIVDDFTQPAQSSIRDSHSFRQNFKCAQIALMSELGVEHVESEFSHFRPVTFRGNKLESSLRVDESPYQPCGSNAIHVDPRARYPRPAGVGAGLLPFPKRRLPNPGFQFIDDRLRLLPCRGRVEVDSLNLC